MTRPRLFTPFDWIMAIGTLILIALIIWFCFILGRPAATAVTGAANLAISNPINNSEQAAGSFTLSGTGTPGEVLEVFQDDFSLGTTTVGADGRWEQRIPSVGQGGGNYTYRVASTTSGREAQTRINFTAVTASSGATCDKEYFLSVTDGQTLSQPFRFGGDGKGGGYTITVKRGERVIGTKPLTLDATCGWGYDSRPGPGTVTYEVREKGAAADSTPLSTVTLTVR